MNKYTNLNLAHTAAIIAGLWYVFCWAFYLISPTITQQVFSSWFHAFDIRSLWTTMFQGDFLLGLLTLMASAWITVYLFSVIYKKLAQIVK